MRLLSLVLRTIMPRIKHTTATGTLFAPLQEKQLEPTQAGHTQDPNKPRSSETSDFENVSFTVDFRLVTVLLISSLGNFPSPRLLRASIRSDGEIGSWSKSFCRFFCRLFYQFLSVGGYHPVLLLLEWRWKCDGGIGSWGSGVFCWLFC